MPSQTLAGGFKEKGDSSLHNSLPSANISRNIDPESRRGKNESLLTRTSTYPSGPQSLSKKGWPKSATQSRNTEENCPTTATNVTLRNERNRNTIHTKDDIGRPQFNGGVHRESSNPERNAKSTSSTEICQRSERRNPYLRIGTVNIGGWSESKAVRLRQIIEAHQLELLVVTETRKPLDEVLLGKGRSMIVRGSGMKHTGVAVVCPQGKQLRIHRMSERYIHVTHPLGIDIIGGYAPTEQASETERKKFWEEIAKIETRKDAVVLGDFNAGNEEMRHPKARSPGKSNFELMVEFAQTHHYDIQEHGATWISPCSNDGRPSRTLDRCLVRSSAYSANTTVDFALRPTDHAVLVLKVHLLDIDRNTGRPFHQALKGVDLLWCNSKQALRNAVPMVTLSARVNEFWKAKRIYEREIREKLQIVGDDGQLLAHEDAVLEIMRYFKSIWSESSDELLKIQQDYLSPLPSASEIFEAIQDLKTETTLGRDKISPEHVKQSQQALEVYQRILNEVWRTGKIPQVWKDLRVKPIQKKPGAARVSEVRPITCVSVSTKILNHIIVQRTKHLYEKAVHLSQHAYRSGYSIESAVIQLLTAIKEKERRYVAFLDMSKAYDSVSRRALSQALTRWKLPATEYNLIAEQYSGCSVYIELHGYSAPSFLLKKGIRQGCRISCMLFALIISEVLDMMDSFLYQKDVEVIAYSDDLVIAAKSTLNLKVAMKYLEECLQAVGLQLNANKTEIVEFLGPENVPKTVKWLGFQLNSQLTWEGEVGQRCCKIREALGTIQKVLTTKRLNLAMKDSVQVAQGMLSTYARVPSFIKLTTNLEEMLHNELLCAIMKVTKMDSKKAESYAGKMRMGDIQQKVNDLIKCEYCGKSFRNKAGIQQHYIFCDKHPNPPPGPKLKCPQCSQLFHSRGFHQHRKCCKINIFLNPDKK